MRGANVVMKEDESAGRACITIELPPFGTRSMRTSTAHQRSCGRDMLPPPLSSPRACRVLVQHLFRFELAQHRSSWLAPLEP